MSPLPPVWSEEVRSGGSLCSTGIPPRHRSDGPLRPPRAFTQPGGVRTAFAYYRDAFSEEALQQNKDCAKQKRAMPVLAVGGQYGVGEALSNTMKGVATEVNGAVLQGCEHFVMEECPNEVIGQLKPFLQSR